MTHLPYEKDEAIVIRGVDFSETSRIYTFYGRRFGRFAALAKGARRRYNRNIGHLDLFSYGEVVFLSGRSRARLHILAEVCSFDTFPRIRENLPRFYAACHAAELVGAMTAEEDPCPELFDCLLALLRRLDGGTDPVLALFAFEAHLLVLTGFMPEVSRCVSCGKAARGKMVSFSLRLGGILCSVCSAGEQERIDELPAGALRLLGRIARGETTRLERVRMAPEVAREMRRLLTAYETYVLGRKLRTARCL